MKVIYEDDKNVLCEFDEVVQQNQDGSYTPSHVDIIGSITETPLTPEKVHIKYIFKQSKLPETINKLPQSLMRTIDFGRGKVFKEEVPPPTYKIINKINEIIDYINRRN